MGAKIPDETIIGLLEHIRDNDLWEGGERTVVEYEGRTWNGPNIYHHARKDNEEIQELWRQIKLIEYSVSDEKIIGLFEHIRDNELWKGKNSVVEYEGRTWKGKSIGNHAQSDNEEIRELWNQIRLERDWSGLNEETARDHYLENYEGLSRKGLWKEDNGFYQALRRKDLLHATRPFYNMEEFNEHLEESGLMEVLLVEWVKDVTKFSEIVKEYCKYNCQTMTSLGEELGIKSLLPKLNPKANNKLRPEEIDIITKYMENPENDRWKEYSLESEL